MPLDHLTLITLAAHEPMKVLKLGSGALTHAHCVSNAVNNLYDVHENFTVRRDRRLTCFYCKGRIEVYEDMYTNTVSVMGNHKGPLWEE